MRLECKLIVLVIGIVLVLVSCKERELVKELPSLSIKETSAVKGLTVPKDSTKLIRAKGIVMYRDEPFTGTTTLHYPNGILSESIYYNAGKRQNYYRKWYPDGSLSYESNYLDGKQHGTTKMWWKNGNLRSESQFEHSVIHGIQKQWYKSGAKFKEIQLHLGKEEGMQRSWRENGKLYNNYEAKDGRIFGLKRANLCFSLENEEIALKK